MKMVHKKIDFLVLLTLVWALFSQTAHGQIRAGAAFLKMTPGARLQAMAGSHSGLLDESFSIYANPGAAGFLREWHWSADYTKWIADVYSASFLFGKQVSSPLSDKTRAAIGILYCGVPEFDSSDHAVPNASANDLVAALNIGQPISAISDNLSLGVNLKYLQSTLDNYGASAFIADFGVLARTPKFRLKNRLFEYGILSAGAAVTQLGTALKYENEGTPLPRTYRLGAGLYFGTHHGMQLQLMTDYSKVRDEKDVVGIGAELSWRHWFSLNAGYNFGNDLLSHFSFGANISIDDINLTTKSMLPGKNNAMRFDLATLDEGEFFSRTYRGGINHQPIRPEPFNFLHPMIDDSVFEKQVVLKWEQSREPDLFDDVRYVVMIDPDSIKLANFLSASEAKDGKALRAVLPGIGVQYLESVDDDSLLIADLRGGDYYWIVLALDRDDHFRFAHHGKRGIAHFVVPYPDIEIEKLEFEYSPWITQNDYHGELVVSLKNNGNLAAKNFALTLRDVITGSYTLLHSTVESETLATHKIRSKLVEDLPPGGTRQIRISWHTPLLGLHEIVAIADEDQKVTESNEENNKVSQYFYTIPKGQFVCDDTVTTALTALASVDMPIITEICFDINSTEVKAEYLHKSSFDPPLAILAERLTRDKRLRISLRGFSDSNTDDNLPELADRRARAVRDSLIILGVDAEQIHFLPGERLPKRRVPANPTDARWVFEERRYVMITSNNADQKILFEPIRHTDYEDIPKAVQFHSEIISIIPLEQGWLEAYHEGATDSVRLLKQESQLGLQDSIQWNPAKNAGFRPYFDVGANYYISIRDTLGRKFKTHSNSVYLAKTSFQREHRIAFPLKFALTDPLYSFYWQRIFNEVKKVLPDPQKRIRFAGHACPIGPEAVNENLSRRRARTFHSGFEDYLKKNHLEFYRQIADRLDTAEGFGENEPLGIARLNGERIIIGNNEKAIGRKLNRRIEVIFSAPVPAH
ncbi:PorV/PorQ family protein [candidate division KSB1 bacterium]|nr:PorV/PorQ family protein [candidate division KSB1 bacterium]